MSKSQKSNNEKVSSKKSRCEDEVDATSAPFTHAFVKFTGNRAHANEFSTVPVYRIKGLGNDFSYDKLSEYNIYWRNPDSENDDDDERRATDDEDYYPGTIIKLGKSLEEIEEWRKKNDGKRIITPTIKSHVLMAAEKPSKPSISMEKSKSIKNAAKERKEKKGAVNASVDSNLQSVLKKVMKSQSSHSDETQRTNSTKSLSRSSNQDCNRNDYSSKRTTASADDSSIVSRLLDKIDSLQEQMTALTADNSSLRTEKEHLKEKVRKLTESEKSLQCTIELLKNDKRLEKPCIIGSNKTTKPVHMTQQESTEIWKPADSDSDFGAGQAAPTLSDRYSSDEGNPVLKKRKVNVIHETDDSFSSEDDVFTEEQIIERKAWSASIVSGGGSYKDPTPLLKIKDKKVYLGLDTWISVASWTTIKKQAKDKMFISHFAVALLGEECYLYNKTGKSKDGREMRKFPEKVLNIVSDFLWRKFMKENDSNQKITELLLKKIDVATEMANLVREKDPKRQEQKAEMRKKKSANAKLQENPESSHTDGRNLDFDD